MRLAPVPRSGSLRSPLLVGRDELLELGARRIAAAAESDGEFILIAGVAGVGKSRFADGLVGIASDSGFDEVAAAVTPLDRDVPGALLTDLARAMRRTQRFEADGDAIHGIATAARPAHVTRRRQRVLELADYLVGMARRPLLLRFEDLHWADELSLEVIGEVARIGKDAPLLLIGTYRSDEVPAGSALREWRSRLLTQRLAEEIRLGALTRGDTALVIALLLDNGLPAPRDVADAVFERTDGVPLHIEELLGALDVGSRRDPAAIRDATVPETIEDVAAARLEHLSSDARTMAMAGAVIGRSFDIATLAAVLDRDPDDVEVAVQELVDSMLLVPGRGVGEYDFRHQLLRDGIYGRVPAGDRRRWHRRAAIADPTDGGRSLVHASFHYERAGDRADAFRTALLGAAHADDQLAHREAFELYARAISQAPRDLSDRDRGDLFAAYALTGAALERTEVTMEAAGVAASSYRAGGFIADALAIEDLMASMARRQGDPTTVRLATAERARSEADDLPDSLAASHVRAIVALRGAMARLDGYDLDGAAIDVAAATSAAETGGDDVSRLIADTLRAAIAVHRGEIDDGLRSMESAADKLKDLGSEEALGSYRDGTELAVQHLRYDTARHLIEQGTAYAEATEQRHCAHVMVATGAVADWATGRWNEAVRSAEQAVADDGCERGKSVAHTALGLVAMGRGQTAIAREHLERGADFADRGEVTYLWSTPMWGLVELELHTGQPQRALDMATSAIERIRTSAPPAVALPFVVTGTRLHITSGDLAAAERWVEDVGAMAAATDAGAVAAVHGAGLIEMAAGGTGNARARLLEAVEGWDRYGQVWESTWARLDLARCLIRGSRHAEAAALVTRLDQTAIDLGSRWLMTRIEEVGRAARAGSHDAEPWSPLTSREFSVARLISEGLTNAEIADELGIAPKTASSHVEHILAKLGASRRAEIATWAASVDRSAAAH